MSFSILGLGLAVPAQSISQDAAADHAVKMWGESTGRAEAIRKLFRHSGVLRRHSVLLEPGSGNDPVSQSFYQPASSKDDRGPSTAARMKRYQLDVLGLAARACEAAIHDASICRNTLTHLVTVSCSGFSAPGIDIGLIKRLGLDPGIARTHVGFMGCHGAFNGLRVAKAISESDPSARVLLCCVELCSLHQQYVNDAQQIVANSLFSDGAAAVVGAEASTNSGWQLTSQRSTLLPDSQDEMTWTIGDHGFSMSLSPHVPGRIREQLQPWLSDWLQSVGATIDQVASWAIHPGGPRILSTCREVLLLPDSALDVSRKILAENGNMSSPTVLFIIDRLRRANSSLPCVAMAFGPGLTIEAALWT